MMVDNKTILISGLLVCAGISLVIKNHDVALAIVSGLVGYLSKDNLKLPNSGDKIDEVGVSGGSDSETA